MPLIEQTGNLNNFYTTDLKRNSDCADNEISYSDLFFFNQGVDKIFSTLKVSIWLGMHVSSSLRSASSRYSKNCNFYHFCIGFIFLNQMLPLGFGRSLSSVVFI